jgi:hypothetical protein
MIDERMKTEGVLLTEIEIEEMEAVVAPGMLLGD